MENKPLCKMWEVLYVVIACRTEFIMDIFGVLIPMSALMWLSSRVMSS